METHTEPAVARPPSLVCANCRITLRGERVVAGDRDFCCEGCAGGGPCCC